MRKFLPVIAIASVMVLPGCEGVGLTLFGVGTGTTASVGVNHTLSGIAYKTFTAPEDNVRKATEDALRSMGLVVTDRSQAEDVYKILASARDRTAEIGIEKLSGNATRMRVTVKEENGFFRDSATAMEIIVQTAGKLDAQVAASNSRKRK
jgi:hypothetical protein